MAAEVAAMMAVERNADVLFDWDNTLKLLDRSKTPAELKCSVPRKTLETLATTRGCRLFVLSAVRNSRMGIETLKIEVEKLGLGSLFATAEDAVEEHDTSSGYGSFWRWGNCIACGPEAPKVGVYLHVVCRAEEEEEGESEERPVYFFDDEINNVECFRTTMPEAHVVHVVGGKMPTLI